MTSLHIGNHIINNNSKAFIVAEISANHLHNFDLTVNTIKAAKDSGADAIKVQTYTPDTLTIDVDNEYFTIKNGSPWDGNTYYNLYKEAHMPWDWQPKLQKIAEDLGLVFLSTPFDVTAVDFLEDLNIPAYKVASFEITDIPLIRYIASKGKPIILSTGIATLREIEEVVGVCRNAENDKIALLKGTTTSVHPAAISEANLRTITDMKSRFDVVIGLSDHTRGNSAAIAGVSLGARIIEKHFILDRNLGGPDSSFSIEPHEFSKMVQAIREAEKALGEVSYALTENAKDSRIYSRSLFIVRDIKKGEILTKDNIKSIRPHYGLHPRNLDSILGKKIKSDVLKGTPLSWDIIID